MGILLASALTFPIDLLVLAAHLIGFHRRPHQTARDAWRLWRYRRYSS
jgi:hypothetical protein